MKKNVILLLSIFLLSACSYNNKDIDNNEKKETNEQFNIGEETIIKEKTKETIEDNVKYYHNYSIKGKQVFWNGKIVEGMDYESFEDLGYDFAKDEANKYFKRNIVTGVDLNTFEVLGYYYIAKDKNYVYDSFLNPIKSADPSTFKLLVHGYAIDEKNIFFTDKQSQGYITIIDGDISSFTPLQFGFSKDKNNVYYRFDIIKDISPIDFKLLQDSHFSNEEGEYYYQAYIEGIEIKKVK